ncbi:MAG TPA: protein translocase subunit SecF [Kofleriaceae bacterium]|jgi:preprotein translocase subunit SecF
MTDHHKFRYLLPPGNNFAFVAKFRIWLVISVLLMCASIGILFVNKAVRGNYMNWTIDFKGGTEIQVAFKDKSTPANDPKYIAVDTGAVRKALEETGDSIDVSDITWTEGADKHEVHGTIISTPRYSAIKPEVEQAGADTFADKFKDRDIINATWSGDRLFVKSKKPVTVAEAKPVFAAVGLELKDWNAKDLATYSTANEDTGEYNAVYAMSGIDKQYAKILEAKFPGKQVVVYQAYAVGARAGDKLRNDAAKSVVFAIFLIMLYLAFRFDIRYAPGAAFATIHDAIMVVGIFAITWTEVSLTSVAGLLTVMGYSVNDTVIVFDRIRENQAKLKDKKIERIIDISINEMLVRTILTSSTVFATTLIMNIFGTGLVKNFAFAMNIGVIVGTYSSIFLAAPIFMWISRKWYSGPAPARRRPAPVQIVASSDLDE